MHRGDILLETGQQRKYSFVVDGCLQQSTSEKDGNETRWCIAVQERIHVVQLGGLAETACRAVAK